MSAKTPPLLPLPRDQRQGQGWPAALGCGAVLLGGPIVFFALTLNENVFGVLFFYGVMYGLPLLVVSGVLLHKRRSYLASLEEYRQVALGAGLTFQPCLRADQLVPYLDFALFRLTMPRSARIWERGGAGMDRAASRCFTGQFEGREVMVFEYEYFGRPDEEARPLRRMQTVVLLPNVSGLPPFHAGPRVSDWDEYWPGWVGRLDVGAVAVEMDTVAHEPTVIRSPNKAAVRRLFRRERLKLLGSLSECCLESAGGHLLFYAPDLDVPASGVPRAIGRAIDIARVLTMPEAELPGLRNATDEPPPENVFEKADE